MYIAWGILVPIAYFFAANMRPAMPTGLWFQVSAFMHHIYPFLDTLLHSIYKINNSTLYIYGCGRCTYMRLRKYKLN